MTERPFAALNPDTILTCIEKAIGRRLLNVCRPHSSYINRVYELQDEEDTFIIAKFFRPERWSEEGLQDEQQFVRDCDAEELPVIAPLRLADGSYLGNCQGICFAVYPRCGGRLVDEYNEDQWLELGRLLGRLHNVGASRGAPGRNRLHPLHTTRQQIDYLVGNGLVHDNLLGQFEQLGAEVINTISPYFDALQNIRIHGDCHSGNLIYRPGESFFIIDFDDMMVGPAVQDFWMLLPGSREDSGLEIELLLEGYETFCRFDRRTLRLIEPLRAMRFIHYISWCGRQYLEDGDTRINDSFGSYTYWQQELADLEDQLEVIRKQQDQ